ncbi:AraC family transcriptional regulator [Paenibacillus sp. PAMC21692]|uniref:helix-turn-helix domain-containing protein n=1 Tax=Paenibacillus sp. PAMC21692 TaxID=2762320 RepID=UPI00164DCADB|nr:AraC family transcriptional regulator [Paenibacillus sp. PAMC21692]QNK56301.1 helix-turn-helix transcriptional regulator [Paenibacillus sp. PAMC21692]
MRFDQFDIEEYRDILLYTIEENAHGSYPFFIQTVTLDYSEGVLHRHKYFQLYYITKGKLKHRINGQEFELIKGDMFAIPPYVPHSVVASGSAGCEAYEIEFLPELINQQFSSDVDAGSFMDFMYIEPFMVVQPRLSLSGKVEIDIENLLNEFMQEFREKKSGFELMVKSIMLRLLVLVSREAALQAPPKEELADKHRESVRRVIEFIESHYAEKIGLEDAVRVSLMSHSYFCSVFKRMTNKSFIRYLNEFRVSKAKEYLKKTDNKVIDISIRTGFDNVTHFNRMFKQLTSMTPNEYKQICRFKNNTKVTSAAE